MRGCRIERSAGLWLVAGSTAMTGDYRIRAGPPPSRISER